MFVLYLLKLVFCSLWFAARLSWSLAKLCSRALCGLAREFRNLMDAEERAFHRRARVQKLQKRCA